MDKSKTFLLVLVSILICGVYYGTVNAQLNDSPPSIEEKSTEVRQYTPLELQLESFIGGLHVGEPKQADNRSGAIQYTMLSPSLQDKSRSKFEETRWVTGQSSPSVNNFRFTKVEKLSESRVQYTVNYDVETSTENLVSGQKNINVEKNLEPHREYWFITSITTKYNEWEAFTPAETVLK